MKPSFVRSWSADAGNSSMVLKMISYRGDARAGLEELLSSIPQPRDARSIDFSHPRASVFEERRNVIYGILWRFFEVPLGMITNNSASRASSVSSVKSVNNHYFKMLFFHYARVKLIGAFHRLGFPTRGTTICRHWHR
jgi:hypothetical protein